MKNDLFDLMDDDLLVDGCKEPLTDEKVFLFKESVRIENERRELEMLRTRLEHEKEELIRESKKLADRIKHENMRIEQEKMFFDKKFKILETGFKQLAGDRETFQREKIKHDTLSEYRKSQNVEDSPYFKGVTNILGLKKRYKDLIKIFHPDNMCGDSQAVVQITNEYEELKKSMSWIKRANN